MSKGGVIILIIAALVFTGLGFVIGQVVKAAGSYPGSEADPAASQSYVDKLVGLKTSELQTEIDTLKALVEAAGLSESGSGNNGEGNEGEGVPNGNDSEATKVKVTSDSVNVRSSASTSAEIVRTVASGTVLTYLGSTRASDGTWYSVRLTNGVEGYVAGWLCGEPY